MFKPRCLSWSFSLLVTLACACQASTAAAPSEAGPVPSDASAEPGSDASSSDAGPDATVASLDAASLGTPCDPRADIVDDGGEAVGVCEGGTSCFDFQRFDAGGYCTTGDRACAAVTCPASSLGCRYTGSGIVGCG